MPILDEEAVSALRDKARQIRVHVVRMTHAAGSGHPGGSLSSADVIAALYFHFLNVDPENPMWEERDRFVLSKGHGCPALYAALAMRGFFPEEDLVTLRKLGSHLQGHPELGTTPGVEACAGAEGQGLSVGIGMALAGRLDDLDYRVFVLLGDGECDTGQTWEAAMGAAHFNLDNLTAIVDRNTLQQEGRTEEIMSLEPLPDKWAAFGWKVFECDGNDMAQVVDAIDRARQVRGQPAVVIARTVKGKGISFMENNVSFHGRAPTDDELETAMKELGVA